MAPALDRLPMRSPFQNRRLAQLLQEPELKPLQEPCQRGSKSYIAGKIVTKKKLDFFFSVHQLLLPIREKTQVLSSTYYLRFQIYDI